MTEHAPTRPPARIAILSHGTSEFDSRAQRIARTCAAAGDTVTLYSRFLAGLPAEEQLDGYRIVRLPLDDEDVRAAAAIAARTTASGTHGTHGTSGTRATQGARPAAGLVPRTRRAARELVRRLPTGSIIRHRFRQFPIRPMRRAKWYERQVEPHDIWHGMWAGSLPALDRVRARHGGHTVYDARDVFLRSRMFDAMPRWQRRVLSAFERRWAMSADAVLQVSEPYAAMMQRDLGLGDIPVVRNCPARWYPPDPRPDRIRQLLGIPDGTAIVLYQGRVMGDRGIEQAMDAILDVPDAVLVIMGFGNQNGDQSSRDPYIAKSRQPPWQGKVHVIDAVPPTELLGWTASADVMVMAIQPRSENHRYMTPQKLWEALAAGVPVVAADLPGFAAVVRETGCGELCDPTSPASIADALRRVLSGGPEAIRAMGDRGLAAAHDRYNWEQQFEVLDAVYARLFELRPVTQGPASAVEVAAAVRTRPTARIAILSQGTSEYDSRAQRIARTLAERGDTVTIYSRFLAELPAEEWRDGYRIVRLPLSEANVRQAAAIAAIRAPGSLTAAAPPTATTRATGTPVPSGRLARVERIARAVIRRVRHIIRRTRRQLSERTSAMLDSIPVTHRFRQFPIRPRDRAAWYARQVEPHDIWHGMWAGSLPALEQVRARHGGRTLYDARDVFLRSRMFDAMPGWQRRIMTRFERRWAHSADAVIQVSEPYAAMMQRDLGLGDIPVVRNCPDRWDPPDPRPDRLRQLLDIPADTRIVLYQGLVMSDRGIEQSMDAILEVPDAVLVIMGPGNQVGSQSSRDPYVTRSRQAPWAGKVHVIDAVPPAELLYWSASSDVMVMPFQPNTENHRYVTPQKMWEAMAAGVPVVASDLPGMAPIVTAADCGVVCDPTSPSSIAGAIRQLLDEGPDALRARGDRGLAAAHATYNWAAQFEILDAVYARLLAKR